MKDRISLVRKEKGYNQDAFAEKLGLTKNFISLIETGKRDPSDRTIKDICREFNVNEEWLRNGTGEMFVEQTRDEEIAEFIGNMQASEGDSFKKRFISMLAKLDESEWEVLEKMALMIHDTKKD